MKQGRVLPALVLALAIFLPLRALAQERTMISRESLVEMFEGITASTDWNMSGPMLWGYFFKDASKDTLEKAVPSLQASGYRLVEIRLGDKESAQDADLWWLHVERVETHTPDTLHDRNRLLYEFADEHGIDAYDGMDVGPAQN